MDHIPNGRGESVIAVLQICNLEERGERERERERKREREGGKEGGVGLGKRTLS